MRVPLIVARYGGTPQLAARVEEVVRSQQNNDTAVAVGQAAAAILERVVVQVGHCGLALPAAVMAEGGVAAAR